MNKHFNEAVEGDDGGLVICRGCKVRGTYTELPRGECPTPYKSDRVLLAESMAREQALQLRLNAADQRIDELTAQHHSEDSLDMVGGLRVVVDPTSAPDEMRVGAKMIGIERMPPMEYDEP